MAKGDGKSKGHGKDPAGRVGNRKFKMDLCTYHMSGRCVRGTECPFAHGEHELRCKPGGKDGKDGKDEMREDAEVMAWLQGMRQDGQAGEEFEKHWKAWCKVNDVHGVPKLQRIKRIHAFRLDWEAGRVTSDPTLQAILERDSWEPPEKPPEKPSEKREKPQSGAQFSQCAWEQDVKTCLETNCQGCGGEQCQLCRADAEKINSCCEDHSHWDSVAPPQMCVDAKAEVDSKDPCSGLYGAEGLQRAWEEDAKTCVKNGCKGCGGEQCQLCREDVQRIAKCCDDHWHSVEPPQFCKDSKEEAVTSCFDSKCHGCGGEQCQLCREDARAECCTGAMRTPSCESSKAILP